VIRGAGNDSKARVRYGLSHLCRSAEAGIISVQIRIIHQGRLLINDGNVTFFYDLLKILIEICKRAAMVQTVTVNRLMDQIIAERHEGNLHFQAGESPGIPYPAVYLPVRLRQQQAAVGGFLSVVGHDRHILPDIGGHPFGPDFPVRIFVYENMLRPVLFILLHPDRPVFPVSAPFPAQ